MILARAEQLREPIIAAVLEYVEGGVSVRIHRIQPQCNSYFCSYVSFTTILSRCLLRLTNGFRSRRSVSSCCPVSASWAYGSWYTVSGGGCGTTLYEERDKVCTGASCGGSTICGPSASTTRSSEMPACTTPPPAGSFSCGSWTYGVCPGKSHPQTIRYSCYMSKVT